MKRILLAVGVMVALSAPALAESSQGRAVSKMIAAKGSGAAIPTGIDVPGPAYYSNDAHKGVTPIRDPRSTRDAKTFWDQQDKGKSGGAEGSPQ